MDFDSIFEKQLKDTLKKYSETHKFFKHPRHNFTTGLIPLDYMINPDNPGLLGGNCVMFCGEGHSGKTTTALNIVHKHYLKGGRTHWHDVENGLQISMLKGFNIPKEGDPKFTYIPPMNAEAHFNLIKNAVVALQGEEEPLIIVVDSISYLRPEIEDFEKVRVGDNIPFFNNLLRSVIPKLGNTNILLIFINGVYADNKNQYNEYIIPGGMTLNRACDLITIHHKLSNGTKNSASEAFKKDINKDLSVAYRQKLSLAIHKNKFNHSDNKLSKLTFYFNTDNRFKQFGLDNTHAMLTFLKEGGVLVNSGPNFKIGDQSKKWAEWEEECNTKPETWSFIYDQVKKLFDLVYHDPTVSLEGK